MRPCSCPPLRARPRAQPLVATALFLILLLSACRTAESVPAVSGLEPGEAGTVAPPLDAQQVAQGKAVYDGSCAACHGPNLEGEREWQMRNDDGSFRAPPHNASGHTWHHSDRVLIESVQLGGQRLPAALGTSHMPAFAGLLSDEEIAAVLAYIKSSWPPEIRQVQWEMTLQDEVQEP